MKLNMSDNTVRNFHGVTKEFQKEILSNNYSLCYDESYGSYLLYDSEGNDIECMTSEELQTRTGIKEEE